MSDLMNFPHTVDEFMEQYKIIDKEEVYTNGAELIPIFRMKQWFEHMPSAEPQWIPCSERLPEKYIGTWLCCCSDGEILILQYDTPGNGDYECKFYYSDDDGYPVIIKDVIAWMPLPIPYRGEQDDEMGS